MSGCDVLVVTSPGTLTVEATSPDVLVVYDPGGLAVVQDTDLDVLTVPGDTLELATDGPQGPPGPSGSAGRISVTLAEAVTAYHVVSIHPDALGYLADASSATDRDATLGVAAMSGLAGETIEVETNGVLIGGTWPVLGPLWLGAAGQLTSTVPASMAAVFSLQVATAVTADRLIVRPQFPITL